MSLALLTFHICSGRRRRLEKIIIHTHWESMREAVAAAAAARTIGCPTGLAEFRVEGLYSTSWGQQPDGSLSLFSFNNSQTTYSH